MVTPGPPPVPAPAGGPRQLVLVGLPASGKSSAAALVAERLGLPHLDSDAWVEQTTGQPISDIFARDGEDAFRRLEERAVAELLARPQAVVSLGGGAVLSPANRQRLAAHDVVWLQVSVATATRRAGLNRLRPLLLGDVRRQLERLETERRPLYEAVADYRVATDRLTPDEVALAVLRLTGRTATGTGQGLAEAAAVGAPAAGGGGDGHV